MLFKFANHADIRYFWSYFQSSSINKNMLHTFFFSPSDTTRKYALAMSEAFGEDYQMVDLTHGACEVESELIEGDTALLLAPVYAGRIPAMAADLLGQIDGRGMKAIVAVVYGNRDYDDALLELADIATKDGFEVVAAGAFIGQHCIFPEVANGRPDKSDMEIAADFIRRAKQSAGMNLSVIKGNRPYKKPGAVPLKPQSQKDCIACGACARECPTGAIDPVTLATDKEKCISCCRCIAVCSSHARKFKGPIYAAVGKIFRIQNSKRREPELFF